MSTTTRSGAIYGIGRYGAVRYGVSNVAFIPDGLQATATSDGGVVVSSQANIFPDLSGWDSATWNNIGFEPVTRESPYTYWYNAYVGPYNKLCYLPTTSTTSVVRAADYISTIPPSPNIGEHVYYHLRNSVGGPIIQSYDLGEVVSFPFDYSYTVRYSGVETTIPNVSLPKNSGATYPVSIGTLNNKATGVSVAPDNTIYQNTSDASTWSSWVESNIRIGDELYLTTNGTRRYYGVVTAKPLISGVSTLPQYGITVSNPENYSTVLASTVLFETVDLGYASAIVGQLIVSADSVTSVVGVQATSSVGDNVSFKLDCEFSVTGTQLTSAAGNVDLTGDANTALSGVSSTALLSSRILEIPTIQTWGPTRFGWYLSNTFVYFYINATSWNNWVDENVEVGHTVYATVDGVRKYYGVVTALPVVSGISAAPQTLITVSNPEGHSGFIDQSCTFEIVQPNSIVYADANTNVIGVNASLTIGDVDVRSINRIPVEGIAVTTHVGSLTIVGESNIGIVSNAVSVTLGSVVAKAAASVSISGVYSTGIIGDVVVANNARPTFDSLSTIVSVGTATVSTTVFDFNAVAALYDRTRTVLVERRSSASERIVAVPVLSRMVYVDKESTPSTRTYNVSTESRKTYTYRKPSGADRSVLVA